MSPNMYVIAGILSVLAIAAIAAILVLAPTQAAPPTPAAQQTPTQPQTPTQQTPTSPQTPLQQTPPQPQTPPQVQTPPQTPAQQTPAQRQDVASRASLEEEIYLRSLTGLLVGRHLLMGFQRVAVVTVPDRICSSLAAATATSFLGSLAGYREGAARVFTYEPGRERELARRVVEFRPDAVYIVYGGEQRMSYVANITRRTLEALAEEGYRGALLIHVRVFLATNRLQTVLADERIRGYLASLPEIRVFTADLQRREFLFHRVSINGTAVRLETYCRVPLTEEHVALLRISLPPPE